MGQLQLSLVYATAAGATILLGAYIAQLERIHPLWLQLEFGHSIIAFGGVVLLAAVSLVLVPEDILLLSSLTSAIAFLAGGLSSSS